MKFGQDCLEMKMTNKNSFGLTGQCASGTVRAVVKERYSEVSIIPLR
jgi:hypothetical protein